jgi:hypothetical protein
LAAKPSHMGVDVDGLAYPCTVLPPAAIRRWVGSQKLSCPIAAVGGGAFPGDVKPQGLDIWWRVDRTGNCATKYYME